MGTEILVVLPFLPYSILVLGLCPLLLIIAAKFPHETIMQFTRFMLLTTLFFLPLAFSFIYGGYRHVLELNLFTLDHYGFFFFTLFTIAAIITIRLSYRYLDEHAVHKHEFYVLLVTALLGAAATVVATHFATLLLGIEVLSISLYAMIAYPERDGPPLEAALKYFVLSGAASSTMLFGMALIYGATGSLAFTSAVDWAESGTSVLLSFGQTMLLVGLFFKLSLVPFHLWVPDVYQGSPTPVAGFVATVSKGAAFAVLLRYTVDGELLSVVGISNVVLVVGVLSMVGGNVLALLQTNLKRLLAYSAIAHFGYLLIALVGAARLGKYSLGVETALFYFTGYFVATWVVFGVIALLSKDNLDADELTSYEGLFWRQPLLAAVLTAAVLSLAGIPLTVGFTGKFFLVATGVETAQWIMLGALVIGSSIGLYYYLRIVYTMTKRPRVHLERPSIPISSWLMIISLGVVIILMGVMPGPVMYLLRTFGGP